jgi:hypothetical protein
MFLKNSVCIQAYKGNFFLFSIGINYVLSSNLLYLHLCKRVCKFTYNILQNEINNLYISVFCIVLTFVFVEREYRKQRPSRFIRKLYHLWPCFSKVQPIFGLAITFQWFAPVMKSLYISLILPNRGLFPDAKTYIYSMNDVFSKTHYLMIVYKL